MVKGRQLFCVVLRVQTPVHTRVHMMNSVVSIIEGEPIENATGEGSGMVEFMLMITAIVLPEIGPENAPGRVKIREQEKCDR